jgi:hypothetical protein
MKKFLPCRGWFLGCFSLIATRSSGGTGDMLDKMKQEAMRRGMMLFANPKVMKMMADPRFINAITQGFALKGRIQSEFDSKLRWVVSAFNLATKEEVESLRRSLSQMEDSLSLLEKRLGQ